MAGGLLDLWNHWSIQILVLLSLTLQVVLVVFAGIRRREAHPVLTFLLWQAYLLADITAIYALGHLSLGSAPREHQLVAFWAPFLLLHLGGPDNITAYALQDNQLWLRHLQTLVAQVLGAAYVLYKHIAGNGSLVLVAAILMFTVGVVKYGERTWALRCGNMDNIRSSLKKESPAKHYQFEPLDQGSRVEATHIEEIHVRHAHSLFHICKCAIVDSWVQEDLKNHYAEKLRVVRKEGYKSMWTLMEIQLSLMYDILHTKASVIHTWFGYCIRLLSPLAAAASFLLFHFSAKDGHSGVDIAVTYVLLSGAFLLETTSLLGAFASTWTYATRWNWLRYIALCTGRWDRFRRLVKAVTGSYESKRRWSGKMGQYNMLHFCTRRDTLTSPLLGRLAKMVGLKEWWNRMHYSWTVEISDDLKLRLFEYIKQLHKNEMITQGVIMKNWWNRMHYSWKEQISDDQKERLFKYIKQLHWDDKVFSHVGVLRKNWGQQVLETYNLYEDNRDLLGAELQEGIIIWHIGTDVFLAKSSVAKDKDVEQEVKAVRVLSNYMMFLLVERPYMLPLPRPSHNRLYHQTCENLTKLWSEAKNPSASRRTMLKELFGLHDDPNTSRQLQRDELANIQYNEWPPKNFYSIDVPRLPHASRVTAMLLEKEEETTTAGLKLVLSVWMDFLFYAANRCSIENHAKKLSSGAELTTFLWLMAEYLHQDYLNKRAEKKAAKEKAKEEAEEAEV